MYLIAGFGAAAVGYTDSNILWLLLLALISFFATFLNPLVVSKIQRKIDNQELSEVTRTFLLTYVTGAIVLGFYYGAGMLLAWLIN